jgi:sulfide dehydrogenase [flavocytochrome c] flavoprotein chain
MVGWDMALTSRRDFNKLALGAGFLTATGLIMRPALAAGAAKIVIIGGGPGGATVANRLIAANPALDITLIEPKENYTTCFYSNLFLGGFRTFQSITHTYDGVKKRGIKVVTDRAASIDTALKTVTLEKTGSTLGYDRLVVAPGIDIKYDSIEGYSEAAAEMMPHAWHGGQQTWLLKEKLLALPEGGNVIMSAPPNPYRCPPGPYERACMIAHFLKAKKPNSKLIIFDAKKTVSKQPVFEEAFHDLYKDVVEFNLTNEIDDFNVIKVNTATGEVTTKSGRTEKAALANIIPAQKAGAIAAKAGLTEGDWCPVNPDNFLSLKAKDVYVVGDAAIAADMPKSAYSAASQGSVVAADILADLSEKERKPGQYRNTCWSMIGPDNSAKIGADYKPGKKDGKGFLEASAPFVSKAGETAQVRRETFVESSNWYDSFTADMFGNDPAAKTAP